MQDKFLNLSNGLRWLIVIALWVLTIASFGGCVLVKQNDDLQWVEVLLTSLGLFFLCSCCLYNNCTSNI